MRKRSRRHVVKMEGERIYLLVLKGTFTFRNILFYFLFLLFKFDLLHWELLNQVTFHYTAMATFLYPLCFIHGTHTNVKRKLLLPLTNPKDIVILHRDTWFFPFICSYVGCFWFFEMVYLLGDTYYLHCPNLLAN